MDFCRKFPQIHILVEVIGTPTRLQAHGPPEIKASQGDCPFRVTRAYNTTKHKSN